MSNAKRAVVSMALYVIVAGSLFAVGFDLWLAMGLGLMAGFFVSEAVKKQWGLPSTDGQTQP